MAFESWYQWSNFELRTSWFVKFQILKHLALLAHKRVGHQKEVMQAFEMSLILSITSTIFSQSLFKKSKKSPIPALKTFDSFPKLERGQNYAYYIHIYHAISHFFINFWTIVNLTNVTVFDNLKLISTIVFAFNAL